MAGYRLVGINNGWNFIFSDHYLYDLAALFILIDYLFIGEKNH
jgi:hypothetical protein